MNNPFRIFVLALCSLTLFSNCKNENEESIVDQLLFPVEKDIVLGKQLDSTIMANPVDYPILDRATYPEAYAYLEGIKDSVLQSDEIIYKEEFEWKVTIINDDNTLNAFAAPGGYLYFYTGLMRFLDNENELAGVMGHEIAHADRRHSIDQMKQQYGVQLLLDVALGEDQGALTQIASGLLSLSFSRGDETEADEFSVKYLCDTEYASDGAAGFFEKLEDGGSTSTPEFLSTHPNPGNRVEDIQSLASDLACPGDVTTGTYSDFIDNMLP